MFLESQSAGYPNRLVQAGWEVAWHRAVPSWTQRMAHTIICMHTYIHTYIYTTIYILLSIYFTTIVCIHMAWGRGGICAVALCGVGSSLPLCVGSRNQPCMANSTFCTFSLAQHFIFVCCAFLCLFLIQGLAMQPWLVQA